MWSALRVEVKIVIVLAGLGVLGGLSYLGLRTGIIPTEKVRQAIVPEKVHAPKATEEAQAQKVELALPAEAPAGVKGTLIRGELWEWSAQMNLLLATGGKCTTKGSLMEKHKVSLCLDRQDDTSKMVQDIVDCARELHDGSPQCSKGANFAVVMTGGAGQFAAAANAAMKALKLGDEYSLRIIAPVGISFGEDCLLVPRVAKNNPRALVGTTIAGVIGDDDWNLAQKFLADNQIRTNPDLTTWDPDAMNWMNSTDYNVAASDYVAGRCEDRKVVQNGKLTGEKKNVCVDGVVTWTPGDVTATKKKGGLVKVLSTRDYLMPAVIIGPNKFFRDHREEMQHLLAATYEAGDQIKLYPAALTKAADVSFKVYGDDGGDEWTGKKGAYWAHYYTGPVEKDKQGIPIQLGGSKVYNLADALTVMGLVPGTNNDLQSAYTEFGKFVFAQYPDHFKGTPIPTAKDILDKTYVTGAQGLSESVGTAETTTYTAPAEDATIISKKDFNINFDTGQATLTSEGVHQLEELKDSVAVTRLYIKVDGYTDNVGSDTVNVPLSRARARAVKTFLQQRAPKNFPDSRFQVEGHGSTNPVVPNTTAANKARNRRVKITLLGS